MNEIITKTCVSSYWDKFLKWLNKTTARLVENAFIFKYIACLFSALKQQQMGSFCS